MPTDAEIEIESERTSLTCGNELGPATFDYRCLSTIRTELPKLPGASTTTDRPVAVLLVVNAMRLPFHFTVRSSSRCVVQMVKKRHFGGSTLWLAS